jgi:hypothetical protein
MQRLRSLRRSMSRSSRKSGASSSSVNSSPRGSQDTPSRDTPDSVTSTPDSRVSASSGDQPTADPPSPSPAPVGRLARDQPDTSQPPRAVPSPNEAESVGDTLSQPQASQASLSTSITDPPVIVEPPSPSPPDAPVISAIATGRESQADSTTLRRKAPDSDPETAAAKVDVQQEKPEPRTEDMPVQRPWLVFAVASGGFAALNGAFAKL